MRSARTQPFTLLNAATGVEEKFAARSFSIVMGGHSYGWTSYPDDWPRPWEGSTDGADGAEKEDEDG